MKSNALASNMQSDCHYHRTSPRLASQSQCHWLQGFCSFNWLDKTLAFLTRQNIPRRHFIFWNPWLLPWASKLSAHSSFYSRALLVRGFFKCSVQAAVTWHSGLRTGSRCTVFFVHTYQSLDSRVRIQACRDSLVALEHCCRNTFTSCTAYTSKLEALLLQSQVPSFCEYWLCKILSCSQ